ncbi:hypothetical protein [Shimazuella alba]|uniref:Uncharacterized protein n=1 Tax=Shimazuella alba TaxID=2690964 RepID=A0A6I4W060_9BACL|nr:hypothetical protein [Shimazuella alba]MXQ55356.1 hypothetical protein [Shimazuella alba]
MAHLSDNDLRKKFASQIQRLNLSEDRIRTIIKLARLDATGYTQKVAATNAYNKVKHEYSLADEMQRRKLKSQLEAKKREHEKKMDAYGNIAKTLTREFKKIGITSEEDALWEAMRDALTEDVEYYYP